MATLTHWQFRARLSVALTVVALSGTALGPGIPFAAEDVAQTACPPPAVPGEAVPPGCPAPPAAAPAPDPAAEPAPAAAPALVPAPAATPDPAAAPDPATTPAQDAADPAVAPDAAASAGADKGAAGTTEGAAGSPAPNAAGPTGPTGPTGPADPATGPTGLADPAAGPTGATGPSPVVPGPAGPPAVVPKPPAATPEPSITIAIDPVVGDPTDIGPPTKPISRRPPASSHAPATGGTQQGSAGHSDEPAPYAPAVSVNWDSLNPLIPPAFGAGDASNFPGPRFLLPIYSAAAAQYGVPWSVLASINEIETGFGRNQGPSSAGAVGWMQFMPSTWAMYGVDANRDGIRNPADPVDAIFAAARYLHAAGAEENLGKAVFAYNHAGWYVERVLRRARELNAINQDLLTTLTEAGRDDAKAIHRASGSAGLFDPEAKPKSIGELMLLQDKALRDYVLADDRVDIYACGRSDVADGVVDRRVLETLEYLAFADLRTSISSFRCGHGFLTRSGNVSEHSSGDAVDIASVNGTSILGHQGSGSITDKTIRELLKLGGVTRPHQIISLMTYDGADNTMSLPDHANHIHVGFRPARPLAGN